MSKKILTAAVFGSLLIAAAVLAQEGSEPRQNIQDLKLEERQNLQRELRFQREALRVETQTLRQNLREEAKELRENLREKVQSTEERARLAVAHGKGLRMINRFRAAVARFDHLLGRLELRLRKLEARGVDISSLTPLLEEAKTLSVQNQKKLEELKAQYEKLLTGDNLQGIGEEARRIAQDLKAEMVKLHVKLKEIASAVRALAPAEANV